MLLGDVDIRIRYFHDSSDEHLRMLGVDRALLPTPEAWLAFYEDDYERPISQRLIYSLLWELDGEPVGFTATDRITFGREAFMHLHLLRAAERRQGLGTEFVRLSTPVFFSVLELERLFCEPNAFNVAPNRTLQQAGFQYVFTHETTPGPFNFPQAVTRWCLDFDAD
jgi:RimJ/RimL family protein N-acetyltransferase